MQQVEIRMDGQCKTLEFAGKELVSHWNMLSLREEGPKQAYPVTLRVDAGLSENGADSYRYAFTEESGTVTGSNPRSVLLGVYSYLRRIGFVFLRPGTGGTYIPAGLTGSDLLCPQVWETASLFHRGVCIEGADSVENVVDFINWLPKNGFNAFFVQFQKPDIFFERWYNHTYNPLLPAQPRTREQFDEMADAVTEAMELRGLMVHRVGHGWTAQVLGFSNTGWRREEAALAPGTQELLALTGGKRQLWEGNPTNTNLCYANPRAQSGLAEQVTAYAKAHPDVDYLHVWLADAYNNICECDACVKTTPSDQYVQILNRIDRRLTEEKLDTKIVFLLYQELLYAPLVQRLHNPGRFCLMFAPISRTFEKPYPRGAAPVAVAPYVRNRMRLPETVEENLTHYFNWKQVFRGDSFFYDYPLGRAHYGDFGYMKIARVIYDDIRTLKGLDTNGYMSCQELRAMTPSGFPNFVMGQALLNEGVSYDALKQAYFRAMFGARWHAVTAYLERLSGLSDTDYFNGHGPRVQPQKAAQFRQIEETAEGFLTSWDSLADSDPRYRDNWAFLKFHAHYCILLSRALALLCTGDQTAADGAFRKFCAYIQRCELDVQSRLDVFRVIEVAVHYTGFTDIP